MRFILYTIQSDQKKKIKSIRYVLIQIIISYWFCVLSNYYDYDDYGKENYIDFRFILLIVKSKKNPLYPEILY